MTLFAEGGFTTLVLAVTSLAWVAWWFGRRPAAKPAAPKLGLSGAGRLRISDAGCERRAALLDRVKTLLPAQVDDVIYILGAPTESLQGSGGSAGGRNLDLLRWAEHQGPGLEVAEEVVEWVAGGRGR